MIEIKTQRSVMIRSALMTPLCLIGTFFIGAALGDVIFSGLLGHVQDETKAGLAALPALICVTVGGGLWGRAMARIARVGAERRMIWAGALWFFSPLRFDPPT